MRDSVVLPSVIAHTLSEVTAIAGCAAPAPAATCAVDFHVLESTRTIAPAPQSITQRLLKPLAAPPQGLLATATGSPGLFVRWSILISPLVVGATSASVMAVQAGASCSCASALRDANGICTPGVFTPALGITAPDACAFAVLPGPVE